MNVSGDGVAVLVLGLASLGDLCCFCRLQRSCDSVSAALQTTVSLSESPR